MCVSEKETLRFVRKLVGNELRQWYIMRTVLNGAINIPVMVLKTL